ncbi:hypothetical protein IQ07DRAFT_663589, partial [Pyrenochaeta sp. DS3sAY3a]
MEAEDFPSYKDMPSVPNMPPGCAWGLFDKNGEKDQLGTLNWLTSRKIQEAGKELKVGVSVSLNWALECIHDPGHDRKAIVHNILDLSHLGLTGHDDEIYINTQTSSQWDSLRHWAWQETGQYYNGLTHAEISGPERNDRNGIQTWLQRGGIVGRGVLLDYASWAEKKGIEFRADTKHGFTHVDLEKVAAEQDLELKPADILIVRTGWIKWYNGASAEDRHKSGHVDHTYCGFNGTPESIQWLWNRVHDTALSLWGMPIGELWDLEALAEECKKQKRWSFLFTSSPLNISGGVASPPNALAVF